MTIGGLSSCGQQTQEKTVKVGINSADTPIWKLIKKKVKKDHINIKLSPAKNNLPSTKNVINNPHNLKFQVLDAAQTAHSLNDVDIAVINGNVAQAAKLKAKDSIYVEKVNHKSKPWVNIIAANKKDRNNPTYKKIVKAYQSEDVLKVIHRLYGPQAVGAWKVKL